MGEDPYSVCHLVEIAAMVIRCCNLSTLSQEPHKSYHQNTYGPFVSYHLLSNKIHFVGQSYLRHFSSMLVSQIFSLFLDKFQNNVDKSSGLFLLWKVVMISSKFVFTQYFSLTSIDQGSERLFYKYPIYQQIIRLRLR